MSIAPAADYFLEIEAHFAMRRGTPFILSAKDWSLMKSWFDDGVPLAIVIEAIDTVFEKNETSGRRKVISSLSYCRHSVKELWRDRKDLYAGTTEAAPEENVEPLLGALAADVERVSPETAAEIRALAAEKSVPKIEERLIEVERVLMQRLLASLPEDERRAIEQPAASTIADADEKTRRRTHEANLRRKMREKFALPRLTLFR